MKGLKRTTIVWTVKVDGVLGQEIYLGPTLDLPLSASKVWFKVTFRGSFDGIGETLVGGFDISEFFLQVLALLFTFLIGCLNTPLYTDTAIAYGRWGESLLIYCIR